MDSYCGVVSHWKILIVLMSPSVRVALLKKSGEQDWRNRINKKQDVAKTAAQDQQVQPWDLEQTLKTKVTTRPNNMNRST